MGSCLYQSLSLDDPHLNIRLVELESCTRASESVRCTLRKVRLENNPQYSALSYVWGDTDHRGTIHINGVKTEVGGNLESALKRIRDGTEDRVLWIDAICIDQGNVAERNSQVSNMGQIFERATEVLCWLGAAKEDFDTALALLDVSELEASRSLRTEEGRSIDEAFFENSLNEHKCAALQHIASSPYWHRTWIIQEIALAREVALLYGSVELQWFFVGTLNFLSAMLELGPVRSISPLRNHKRNALFEFSMATMAVEKLRQRQQGSPLEKKDIFSLMIDRVRTDASDSRDKIFGLHGLAYDSSRFVTVDCSKSVVELYQSFAQRHIQHTQTLNVILRAGVSDTEQLPTQSLPFLGTRLEMQRTKRNAYAVVLRLEGGQIGDDVVTRVLLVPVEGRSTVPASSMLMMC